MLLSLGENINKCFHFSKVLQDVDHWWYKVSFSRIRFSKHIISLIFFQLLSKSFEEEENGNSKHVK